VESKSTWKWFLETLKQDLGIQNTYLWTIMTNKQKVIYYGCLKTYPFFKTYSVLYTNCFNASAGLIPAV